MSKFRLSAQAADDLEDIWDYVGIEKASPAAAQHQIDIIHEKFVLLVQNPLLGERCDLLRPGLRFFTAGNYVVFYIPAANGIEVERIIHGARNIEAMF
jgi:toxin ParE1/3/4